MLNGRDHNGRDRCGSSKNRGISGGVYWYFNYNYCVHELCNNRLVQ